MAIRVQRNYTTRRRRCVCVVHKEHMKPVVQWFIAVALGLAVHAAQADGPYASLAVGWAGEDVGAGIRGVNHPTRCDRLLHSNPSSVSADTACTDTAVRQIGDNEFDLGGAFTGSARLGYAWARVRVEAAFSSRAHEGETVPFVTPGDNPALQGKASEWSPDNPPYYRLSDFSVRSLFLNLYYGFGGNAAWTPYVGIGAGLGRVRTNYAASFQRRTLADGYVAAAGGDPERPQEWQLGAAGTSSVLDTQLREEVFGYQLIGGVERVLREGVTAFVTVRWTGFDDIAGEDVWATIRSHRPVQADGVTPFETEQALEGIGGLALSVGIRYGF